MALVKGPNGQFFSIKNGKTESVAHKGYKAKKAAPSFDMSKNIESSAQMYGG